MGIFSGLFGSKNTSNDKTQKSKPSFEEQLETFNQLGFKLNPGIEITDLEIFDGGKKAFENEPYKLMYQALGFNIQKEPWTPITNQCWDFDTEAIEDHGAYVDIMNNISRISNGDLIFENVQDYVDIEEGIAWVSFTCKGDHYKWDLKVDDDWVDGSLFDMVQALTVKYSSKGKFTFFNTGGQDFVLGYHTPEELDKNRQATGIDIVRLNAKGQIY